MTISTTSNRAEHTGNGVTTAFSFPYYFLADADLKVYKAGVLQTITTHYTVSGAGNPAGGTVTFVTAPANGNAVIILRDPALTQTADYVANDPFPAATHEQALDKLTMIDQRLKDRIDRAAVLPDTVASSVNPALPTPSAGKALLWNSSANALENSTDNFNDIVTNATTQAGIATTQAGIATTQAGLASTARVAAELAETNAELAEANAEAAAAAAQAAADSIGFRDVIFLTSASSPYTVAQATSGKLLSVDTSGGAVTINLPTIATLTLPFTVGIKKTTGDANAVTINRGGTDTFDDGSTSKTLSGIAGTTLIPDTDPAPDKWTAADWGAASGQQKKQQFVGGVDFTAGVTTTLTITETPIPSTKDALEVFFDGAYQQESEWEYNASTGVITFDVAIPGGTARVETVWASPLTIGTPADATVSTAKLADEAVTSAKIDDLLLAGINDFRLTLTSGAPVTTADVTGATTVYCAPYKGKRIALYDGTRWNLRTSAEFSLALGTLTSGLPYDVFCYDNSGTPTLEFLAWTNGTTRATALTYQDGVLVKTGALTRRYLGTFYTTSTTATEDSAANRYLWNYYHRVHRPMRVQDANNSWTYTTGTYRQANNLSSNQLNFMVGVSEDKVTAHAYHNASNTGTGVSIYTAIGLDSTSSKAADCINSKANSTLANNEVLVSASYCGFPGVGRHFLAWLEASSASGTTTWRGDDGGTFFQTGIFGEILG